MFDKEDAQAATHQFESDRRSHKFRIQSSFLIFTLLALAGLVIVGMAVFDGWKARLHTQGLLRSTELRNLTAIHTAMSIFAAHNDGKLPSNPRELVDIGELLTKDLQSPFDNDDSDFCDYFFVDYAKGSDCPGGLLPPTWMQAFSDPADNDNWGGGILYLDGHTTYRRQPEFDTELARFKADYESRCGSAPVIHPPS